MKKRKAIYSLLLLTFSVPAKGVSLYDSSFESSVTPGTEFWQDSPVALEGAPLRPLLTNSSFPLRMMIGDSEETVQWHLAPIAKQAQKMLRVGPCPFALVATAYQVATHELTSEGFFFLRDSLPRLQELRVGQNEDFFISINSEITVAIADGDHMACRDYLAGRTLNLGRYSLEVAPMVPEEVRVDTIAWEESDPRDLSLFWHQDSSHPIIVDQQGSHPSLHSMMFRLSSSEGIGFFLEIRSRLNLDQTPPRLSQKSSN